MGEIVFDGRVVPFGEVRDEIEERTAQLHGVVEQGWLLPDLLETYSALWAENLLSVMRSPRKHFAADLVAK